MTITLVREQARVDVSTVVAAIVTAWTDYPLVVEMDNRQAVDQAKQVKPYLQVELRLITGQQADLADNPLVRQDGQILLSVVAKAGSGTSDSNKLLDFIRPYFNGKRIGILECKAFEDYPCKPKDGWYYSLAVVNFYYNYLTN
jgi:hypothetical protein